MLLTIIGFLCVVGLAIYLTVAGVTVLFGEAMFTGTYYFSSIFLVLAALVWTFAWWLNPFTISIGVS